MQHWTPSDDAPVMVEPPRDAWAAWLNRAPIHHVTPPPAPPRHWAGAAVVAGLFGFWAGVAALGWALLG